MTKKHNLDGIVDPETLEKLLAYVQKAAQLPFVRVEYAGEVCEKITFWRPKDVPAVGSFDIAGNYVTAFLEYCGKGNSRYLLFPLIVAEMMKNGKLDETDVYFLEDIARYALLGYAMEHFASWAVKVTGDLTSPDLLWINTTPEAW